MNDIEMRRVILQFAYDHRYERPLRLVSTEDMPFLKAFDIVRVRQNIQILRDMGLVKTENATWTALSITTQGIGLVERPEGLDREFPIQREIPRQTKEVIDTVEELLARNYTDAWNQFRKAKMFLYDTEPPDYLNCVKEAVGAVEGLAKVISNRPKDTLSKLLPEIKTKYFGHPAIGKIYEAVYDVRGDEPGIGHGAYVASNFEYADAEFMLNASGSLIIYLARKETDRKN